MTQPKNSEHKVIAETAHIAAPRPESRPESNPESRPEPRRLLRQLLRQKRQSILPDQKKAWDEQIGQKLMIWWRQNQPASLGVYWPIQAEPDLRPVYHQLQQAGCQLALPLVTGKDQPLSFLEWQAGDAMTTDCYGIAIPAHGRQAAQPQALLVPCLGWNAAGFRLGYGGGYYDRSLERQPRPFAIGIAYHCTQIDFAAQAHDIAMDLIISA